MQFTYIELFSGPGGLSTGFRRAGFAPLISVEVSETTVKTYSSNYNVQVIKLSKLIENEGRLEAEFDYSTEGILIHGDVRQVSNSIISEILKKRYKLDTVDMIVGCPPCESFSMAGKRLEEDDRNDLFKEVLRVAYHLNAKIIFFENVKGLLTKKRYSEAGGQFKYLTENFEERDALTKVKYRLVSKDKTEILLNAADYGVPQKRERIFLIGINEEYPDVNFKYPDKSHGTNEVGTVCINEAFYDLPQIISGEGDDELDIEYTYKINNSLSKKQVDYMTSIANDNKTGKISSHKASKHKDYMVKRFSNIKQGEGMQAAFKRLKEEGKDEIAASLFPKKLFAARGRRLVSTLPAFTVTSHCFDEMLHPYYDRALTPREVARLQTFPDNYIFEGPYTAFHSSPIQDKYEQIGDAVPVLLAEKLGKELRKILDEIYKN